MLRQVDWQRALELFDQASELAPAARSPWLDTACGGDTGLRGEVERLLQASEQEDGILEREIATSVTELADGATPQRIGPYRVLKEIARGGMGAVYLAERADGQYQARVAIKLVHSGSISHAEFQRRFLRERQFLASLRHPNIASLLDGGITDAGIPYLVMEYVDGQRVDEYCRSQALSLEGRIRLFQRICLAVQHAHRGLIVHRDIKPSNILVGADGEPKLLDFGIAKNLANSGMAATVALTRPAQRIMTLEYASPEQFRGETVTTATDVYSLGILLYEILADRHPFEEQRCDFLALQHAVCEREPPELTPAAGLGGSGDAVRDLRYIVTKAIRKQPAARYGSVEQFSGDLERYLGGYPVLARQGDRRYRAAKFVRRHRAAVTAAVTIAGLLMGFSIAMAKLAANLREERDLANQQRQRAQTEASFLNSLFNASDPFKQTGAMPTARDLLDRGAARITKELDSEPAVSADLLDGIAQAYEHLALPQKAMEIYRQEAATAERAFGPNSEEKAHALRQLGDMERSGDDLADAEIHLRQALAIMTKLPPGNPEPAHVYNNLALLLQAKGDWAEAEADFRHAIAISSRFSSSAAETVTMRSNLASLMMSEHRYGEAESLIRDTLAQRRRMLGENHPFVGTSLRMLSNVMLFEGHYHDAVTYCRQGIAVYKVTLQPGHPYYAGADAILARALRDDGQFAESETVFRRAIEEYAHLPNRQEIVAGTNADLAQLLLLEGRDQEAMQTADRATNDARATIYGLVLARVLTIRGEVEVAVGRDSAAEKDLDEAQAILGKQPETLRSGTSDILFYRAEALRFEKKSDAAAAGYQQAIAQDRSGGDPEKLTLAGHLLGYAAFLTVRGDGVGAEKAAREALDIRERSLDADAWQTSVARSILAAALTEQGRPGEAQPLAARARTELARRLGAGARPTMVAAALEKGPREGRVLCCIY